MREIQLGDSKRISELSEQLGYPSTIEETKNRIREVVSSTNHKAIVALENNIIVGWIHAFKSCSIESNPFVEIAGLVVDQDSRGNGVGRQLVEKVISWTLEMKIGELRVRSNIQRFESHQFYPALGFKEIKQQKVYQLYLQQIFNTQESAKSI